MRAIFFGKVSDPDEARLRALVARLEGRIRRAFDAFLADARGALPTRRVADLLAAGRIDEALAEVERYIVRFASVIPETWTAAGQAEVAALVGQLSRAGNVGLSFNPGNPRAARAMEAQRLDLIRQMTDSQRAAIRVALTDGLSEGRGAIGQARAFRDAIGLTERQWRAVSNYRRLLREGDAEALARDIRDRRFDPSVRRAVNSGEPLSAEHVDRMVERYTARYHQYRAEMIARTEGGRALSEGREEGLRQVREGLELDDDQIVRVWRSTRDARTRDTHRSMDGQERRSGEAFVSPAGARLMYPHDPSAPAEETIACRCVVVHRIEE